MTGFARLVPLLFGLWFLAACGVKSDPRPPKPKPSSHISFAMGSFAMGSSLLLTNSPR